jgi:hypothetical protein
MPSLACRLLVALLLAFALPAAAQDLMSGDAKSESSSDVLQRLLLGKVKEKSATTAGTKAAPVPGTAERLPRKALGSASAAPSQPEAAPAKPGRLLKPRPARQAELPPLPRLKPMAPISASPTIQLPKPTPMPPGSLP